MYKSGNFRKKFSNRDVWKRRLWNSPERSNHRSCSYDKIPLRSADYKETPQYFVNNNLMEELIEERLKIIAKTVILDLHIISASHNGSSRECSSDKTVVINSKKKKKKRKRKKYRNMIRKCPCIYDADDDESLIDGKPSPPPVRKIKKYRKVLQTTNYDTDSDEETVARRIELKHRIKLELESLKFRDSRHFETIDVKINCDQENQSVIVRKNINTVKQEPETDLNENEIMDWCIMSSLSRDWSPKTDSQKISMEPLDKVQSPKVLESSELYECFDTLKNVKNEEQGMSPHQSPLKEKQVNKLLNLLIRGKIENQVRSEIYGHSEYDFETPIARKQLKLLAKIRKKYLKKSQPMN